MPRSSSGSSNRSYNHVNASYDKNSLSYGVQEEVQNTKSSSKFSNQNDNHKQPQKIEEERKQTSESLSLTVNEQVFHRKSSRRRMARDIFLVFEEAPNSRRSRGSNRRSNKPKFAHLKVENPHGSRGLLRDMKNSNTNSTAGNKTLNANGKTKNPITITSDYTNSACNGNGTISEGKGLSMPLSMPLPSTLPLPKPTTTANSKNSQGIQVAKVNPIFLWVKQDDTRIVEVRCEDYDKRNRIRITRTENGWKAIPRTDPTTSKVVTACSSPRHTDIALNTFKLETNEMTNLIDDNIYNSNTLLTNSGFIMDDITAYENMANLEANMNDKNTLIDDLSCTSSKCRNNNNNTSEQLIATTNGSSFPSTDIFETIATTKDPNEVQRNDRHRLFECSMQENEMVWEVTKDVDKLNEVFNGGEEGQQLQQPQLSTGSEDHFVMDNNAMNIVENDNNNCTEDKNLINNERDRVIEEDNKMTLKLCPKTGLFVPDIHGANELLNINQNIPIEIEANEDIHNPSSSCDYHTVDIPNSIRKENEHNNVEEMKDVAKIIEHNNVDKIPIEEISESLEAKTENLKDLLDNEDLLQHCDDNANADAELIDTLVMTSCEQNLLQDAVVNESNPNTNPKRQITELEMEHKTLPSAKYLGDIIISNLDEPPKCLSFNEAGEIEDDNGDLFQANDEDIDRSFDKQNIKGTTKTATTYVDDVTTAVTIDGGVNENIVNGLLNDPNDEESPHDLSYKKREEICPPSESRSQCAVTSSSDVLILKSPPPSDDGNTTTTTIIPSTPPLSSSSSSSLSSSSASSSSTSSSLAASSETLKNLIFEQVMKLKHYNVAAAAVAAAAAAAAASVASRKSNNNNNNTINKTNHDDNRKHIYDDIKKCNNSNSKFKESLLEGTLITDGQTNEIEPQRKRLKRAYEKNESIPKQTSGRLDKDPDPLTQLQLLLNNTQWKVPDPILVPKERLRAVLDSPAREIPLLITTRPELRLPDAFAYPDIIQNPNILVISMAQLEAILRNEMCLEITSEDKEKTGQSNAKQRTLSSASIPTISSLSTASSPSLSITMVNDLNRDNIVPQASSSPMTSKVCHQDNELNAMNINNNNVHEEIIKRNMKIPGNIISRTSAPNKPTNKFHETKDKNSILKNNCATSNSTRLETQHNLSNKFNAATLAVLNQMLWLPYLGHLSKDLIKSMKGPLQSLIQHKLQNLMPFYNANIFPTNSNLDENADTIRIDHQQKPLDSVYESPEKQLSSNTASSNVVCTNESITNKKNNCTTTKSNQKSDTNTNLLVNPNTKCIDKRDPHVTNREAENKTKLDLNLKVNEQEHYQSEQFNTVTALDVIENYVSGERLQATDSIQTKSSTAVSSFMNNNNNNTNNNTNNKCKPRLTCKSLSNLLEPEYSNLQNDYLINNNTIINNNNSLKVNNISPCGIQKTALCKGEVNSLKSFLNDSILNLGIDNEFNGMSINQQTRHGFGGVGHNMSPIPPDISATAVQDTNILLWHPLFGSNAKPAYTGHPWQWTTVTAAGE